MPKRRVIVYVDGFNFYHAIKEYKPNKIDLWALFSAFIKEEEELAGVKYFSAYAYWLPDKVRSHKRYVKLLEESGVEVILGQFKNKPAKCRTCGERWIGHEEKETDINIALHLVTDAADDNYDRAYIVSADSDLVPAVQTVRQRHSEKGIFIATPPGCYSHARDLRQAGHASIEIYKGKVKRHAFHL